MAEPTAVNGQITDAVTQANVTVLGQAPAQALGTLYQAVAHSVSLALVNATQAQAALQVIGNAATAASVRAILGTAGLAAEGAPGGAAASEVPKETGDE